MSKFNTTKITTEELPRVVAEFIETFETFLDVRGIKIQNPEKDEAIADGEDEESIATIYGSDYGELQTGIEQILMGWNLAEPYD